MSSERKQWFVLYTKSRQEKKVAERLREINIEVYCPLRKLTKQWSDRIKKVEEPLFSSYVFVHLLEAQREAVFQVPGVVRYLFWLGKPAIVKDQEIEKIKKWLNEFDHSLLSIKTIQPGDIVRVQTGALMDQRAGVIEKKGKKLKLLLESLGVIVSLDLNKNSVSKV